MIIKLSSLRFAFAISPERLAGVALVMLMHATVLYELMSHRMLPDQGMASALLVNFISPLHQTNPEVQKPALPSRVKPVEKPPARQLIVDTSVPAPADFVVPAQPVKSEPAVETPVMSLPAGPVKLGTELSLVCFDRPAPDYPAMSRRSGENGLVMVRVELNESGNVTSAKVDRSSGFPRLDEAALSAVRQWRCTAPNRNGQAARAVALQPFNFVLQGS